MKFLISILVVVLLCIGTVQSSYAQNTDSIATQRVNYLKQLLTLNNNQYTTIKNAYTSLLNNINSIEKLNLTTAERSTRLSQYRSNYRTALKNTLTASQWNIYENKRQATQQIVEQYMQQENVRYNLLNNQ